MSEQLRNITLIHRNRDKVDTNHLSNVKKTRSNKCSFPWSVEGRIFKFIFNKKKREIPQICIIIKTFPVFYERQSYILLLQFDVFINVSIQIKKIECH